MSIRATSWAWTVGCTPTAKLVLLALADFADETGFCWPSQAAVVDMTGLSERAVRTAIGALIGSGTVLIERAGNGRGHTPRYRLRINQAQEKGQDVPPSASERGQQMPPLSPERGQQMPERGHVVPERGQQMPPNHQEPSVTTIPKKKVARSARTDEAALPEWLPAEAWADWCVYRRGKTWTQRAAELSIANLDKLRAEGSEPAAVINQSIANGWRGLFPVKATAQRNQPANKLDWIFTDTIFGGSDDGDTGGMGALPAPSTRFRA